VTCTEHNKYQNLHILLMVGVYIYMVKNTQEKCITDLCIANISTHPAGQTICQGFVLPSCSYYDI